MKCKKQNSDVIYSRFEDIIIESAKDSVTYLPVTGNVFGFWMQTLADIQFLNLELSGLTKNYKISSLNYNVSINSNKEKIKKRIAHLGRVEGKQTLYSYLVHNFNDTNAYCFHNLYPYKGKFYPRLVRTLINTFNLNKNHLLLDPFNGCGTTTHEASLMGIKNIGIDINPIGNIISNIKNELLFVEENEFDLSDNELLKIFDMLERKIKLPKKNKVLYQLLLLIYFDTKDAFFRTSRYKSKGQFGLFKEKFFYIKDCIKKTKIFLNEWKIEYVKSIVKEGSVLDLNKVGIKSNSIDAIITSPPYYFSLDYVGKDKIAYDYLNEIKFFNYNMKDVKNKYIGMKIKDDIKEKKIIEKKIISYFHDLEISIKQMVNVLKPNGKIAIVIGDSTISGNKLPTTKKTNEFCIMYGLKHIKTIFNPLLGARNRAIRGESILLYKRG